MGRGVGEASSSGIGQLLRQLPVVSIRSRNVQIMETNFDLIKIASGKNISARRFAERHHRGQTRKADPDVPYYLHPEDVCDVVLAAGGDRNASVAALLHDVVEDTDATEEDVREEFGNEVAALVMAVTKGPEMRGVKLPDQADVVFAKIAALQGTFGVATRRKGMLIKGADVLRNATDLVKDFEKNGPPSLDDIFKAHRVKPKITHYLKLMDMIARDLDATEYGRLPGALDFRAAELRAALDVYLQDRFDRVSAQSARMIDIIDQVAPGLIADREQLLRDVTAERIRDKDQTLYSAFTSTIDPSQTALVALTYLLNIAGEDVDRAPENLTAEDAQALVKDVRRRHSRVHLSAQQRRAVALLLD